MMRRRPGTQLPLTGVPEQQRTASALRCIRDTEVESMTVTIRTERPVDAPAREALLDIAYGAERHRKPSCRLRQGRKPADGLSLIAVERGRVIGTVRLWHVEAGRGRPALLLGPLAVHPDHRSRGIGAALMQRALAEAAQRGHAAVLLVGDAAYYSRFGFIADSTRALRLAGADPARLLAVELKPDALRGAHGTIAAAGEREGVLPVLARLVKPRAHLIPRAA
jgi:predicted N-acetyltransferase YhbS